MPTPVRIVRIIEEDLRCLVGSRTAGRGEDLARARPVAQRPRKEASRPRAPRPYLLPDMTAHSSPMRRTAPGASPASRTAISTAGERPPSAAAISLTVANPQSRCLLWRRLPLCRPAPVRPGSIAQVAVPPLPVPSGCMLRLRHRDIRI